MHSLDSVLALPDDALYLCLGDYLAASVSSFGVVGLSEAERALWFSREFDWAVRDRGLLGYFVLAESKDARFVEVGLRTIGAVRAAAILQEVIAAREASAVDRMDSLFARFARESEDLQVLICRFAREHRDELLHTH